MLHFRNLGGLKKTRKTARYVREKRQLHHFILRQVLLELQSIRDGGGIEIMLAGKLEKIWPCLLCIITDEPEAKLCALMDTCRFCECSNKDLADAVTTHEDKDFADTELQRANCIADIKAQVQ